MGDFIGLLAKVMSCCGVYVALNTFMAAVIVESSASKGQNDVMSSPTLSTPTQPRPPIAELKASNYPTRKRSTERFIKAEQIIEREQKQKANKTFSDFCKSPDH